MSEPLTGLLHPGPAESPAAVARALAGSLAPRRARDEPPPWLDSAQGDAFRLLLHAVRADGAVLCAEPVGSGKTYLALAVAKALGAEPAVCFVPASLVPQWQLTAQRLGVTTVVWSHARLSRGRLPPGAPSLVIVDESHHFRHPGIRRYRTLAPWLVGKRVLLLSATPIVNSPGDLYHQLHLGLRDDALAEDGAPSLRAAFGQSSVPAALGRFVVQRLDSGSIPSSRQSAEVVDSEAVALLEGLDSLALSSHPEVAALVRSAFLRAATSSAAALLATLRRYQHLLRHAEDARAAGHPIDRKSLRQVIGGSDAQLLFWSLLPAALAEGDLRIEDLRPLTTLIDVTSRLATQSDAKSTRLEHLLADGVPTLVFVTARETVTFLRGCLSDRWVAWCTGERAGIGRTSMSRHDVLGWFRPGRVTAPAGLRGTPRTLLTTDVAAEGLDLQTVGRVVHYDLPWTDVRLAQRDGRAIRRGAERSHVDIVRFLPGPAFETRLHQLEILLRKSRLPSQHGLGVEGRGQWRWRRELAATIPGAGNEGLCAVGSDVDGVLAGVALERGGEVIVSAVYWRVQGVEWIDTPEIVEPRLLEAARALPVVPPSGNEVSQVLSSLAPVVRGLLRASSERRTVGAAPASRDLRLGRRLRSLATNAARRRDAALLHTLERALGFCTGGHTAGEAMLTDSLTTLDDTALLAALPGLPAPSPHPSPLHPRLTGLIVFRRSRPVAARRPGSP